MFYISWSEKYNHPLPDGHRFPMLKYDLIPEQLIREGWITEENIINPSLPNLQTILLTHQQSYVENLFTLNIDKSHQRRIGFPLSEALINREFLIMQGTVDMALMALKYGVAMNVAGGTHHAFSNRGEGFCLLNDQAIAANFLLNQGLVSQILIIDLDVHQGNGTASIFTNEPRVFTFSMHGKNNFPFLKEKSDLDVELPDKIADNAYLNLLAHHLEPLLDRVKPDFVFYQCGVDILATDQLGKLNISPLGSTQRDLFVFSACKKRNIPVAASLGGGYSARLSDIVDAHCRTFQTAIEIFF